MYSSSGFIIFVPTHGRSISDTEATLQGDFFVLCDQKFTPIWSATELNDAHPLRALHEKMSRIIMDFFAILFSWLYLSKLQQAIIMPNQLELDIVFNNNRTDLNIKNLPSNAKFIKLNKHEQVAEPEQLCYLLITIRERTHDF